MVRPVRPGCRCGRFAAALMASVAIVACAPKPAGVVDTCHPADLAKTVSATGYAGARDRMNLCLKRAVWALAGAGGPEAAIAPAALARCRAEAADVIAELRKLYPVYPYQKTMLEDEYLHLASLTAVQARSLGCGGPRSTDD